MIAALLLSAVLPARSALAWDRHSQLTRLALEGDKTLDAGVAPETLADYLKAAAAGSAVSDFLKALKLNGATDIGFSAGETSGSTVSVRAVLERYSDEPDWGMDQDLYGQYPELWKPDYQYMCQRTGGASRGCRHMYWPGGLFKPPVPPGKFPVLDPTPIGEAPERAQLFYDKSREAFRAGHPYWGARFLAWGLHYLEDLTQPFHAAQLPSLSFLRFAPDGKLDVEATARVVAFYHLAVDAFPARAAASDGGADAATAVRTALSGSAASPFTGAGSLCREAAAFSAGQSGRTADAGLEFLPPMAPGDAADPYGRVQSPDYWKEVRDAQAARPQQYAAFMDEIAALLSPAGERIRSFVSAGLKDSAPSAAPTPVLVPFHAPKLELKLKDLEKLFGPSPVP